MNHTSIPATDWQLILTAGGDGPAARAAMEGLCKSYLPVAYTVISRRRRNPDDAQELTQQFFLELLRREDISRVKPGGRFRGWFFRSLRNFLNNDSDRNSCAKRDTRKEIYFEGMRPAEYRVAEPRHEVDPEHEFDHAWALHLLERTRTMLAAQEAADGYAARFQAVQHFLPGRMMFDAEYEEPAAALGLPVNTLKIWTNRLRGRYENLLKAEVARTAETPEQVQDELRFLYGALLAPWQPEFVDSRPDEPQPRPVESAEPAPHAAA